MTKSPIYRLRRRSVLLRVTALYLAVAMAFPAPLWAQVTSPDPSAAASTATTPPAPADPNAPAQAQAPVEPTGPDTRAEVRHALHLASWKMAYLVKKTIPSISKIRLADHYELLSPYQECGDPFETLPTTIEEVHQQILKPAQDALSKFLTDHYEDLGKILDDQEINSGPHFAESVTSSNGAQCEPSIFRPEVSTTSGNAKEVQKLSEMVQKLGGGLPMPFFGLLRAKRQQKEISDYEFRVWIGWGNSLRRFRGIMSRFYRFKDGIALSDIAPDFKVPWYVGQKLQENMKDHQDEAAAPLAKLGADSALAKMIGAVAEFVPCEGKGERKERLEESEKFWCFKDSSAEDNFDVDEEIFFGIHATEKHTHGKNLNALRKMAVKALVGEKAVLRAVLNNQQMTLPDACLVSKGGAADLAQMESYYDLLTTTDPKLYWAAQFGKVVKKVSDEYQEHKRELPLPQDPNLYAKGQELVEKTIAEAYEKNAMVFAPVMMEPVQMLKLNEAPKKEEKSEEELKEEEEDKKNPIDYSKPLSEADQKRLQERSERQAARLKKKQEEAEKKAKDLSSIKKDALLAQLKEMTFANRLRHGDTTEIAKGDFAAVLAEKLRIWYSIAQEQLGAIDETLRETEVPKVTRQVVELALVDSLEMYLLSMASQDSLARKDVVDLWNKTYKTQWRNILRSETFRPDLTKMAQQISKDLLSQKETLAPYDPVVTSEATLTRYAQQIPSAVDNATRAADTLNYLDRLSEMQTGWRNLAPGPWNYHWKVTGTTPDPDHAPNYTRLDDGYKHGYGYSMALPDPRNSADYKHVKIALAAVAARRRDALIDRLKVLGFTDENCRQMYGTTKVGDKEVYVIRNVGVLADLILQRFNELLEAKDLSDRARVSENRAMSLWPLKVWLQSPTAPRQFEAASNSFTRHLYTSHLKSLFQVKPEEPTGKAWDDWSYRFTTQLDAIAKNEIYVRNPDPQEVLNVYLRYEQNLRLEKESADAYADYRDYLMTMFNVSRSNKVFDKATWITFAKVKADSLSWLDAATAPMNETDRLRALFEWRATQHTRFQLSNFLQTFGANGPTYDPKAIPPQTEIQLESIKNEIRRAWYGTPLAVAAPAAPVPAPAPAPPAQPGQQPKPEEQKPLTAEELKEKDIDDLLVAISQKAHVQAATTPEKITAILADAEKSLAPKLPNLFTSWKALIDTKVSAIREAINSGSDAELEKVHPFVQDVFSREYRIVMQGPSGAVAGSKYSAEGRLIEDLRVAMLPDFPTFSMALQDRIAQVEAAQSDSKQDIQSAQKAIRDLNVKLSVLRQERNEMNILNKINNFGTLGTPIEETPQYRQTIRDIKVQEDKLKNAEARQMRMVELRRWTRNYLSEIEGMKEVLKIDEEEKKAERIEYAHGLNQFISTKTDAVGNKMELSPDQILADLNVLSMTAAPRFTVTGKRAKDFLEDLKGYCEINQSNEFKAQYTERYRSMLTSLVAPFQDKELAKAIAENQPESPMLAINERPLFQLWRLYHAKNGVGILSEESSLENYKKRYDAFKSYWRSATQQPTPEAQSNYFLSQLPNAEMFCNYLIEESNAIMPAAVKAADREAKELADKKAKLKAEKFSTKKTKTKAPPLVKNFTTGSELNRYWNAVQLASDMFFTADGPFGPVHVAVKDEPKHKTYWFRNSPALVTETAFHAEPYDWTDESVADLLLDYTDLPGETETERGDKDRLQWLNALSVKQRLELRTKIFDKFVDVMKDAEANSLSKLPFKEGETVSAKDYSEWHQSLRHHLLYWDWLKSGLRQESSVYTIAKHPMFPTISEVIFQEFAAATDYRIINKQIQQTDKPSEAKTAIDEYRKLTPTEQFQVIEDIEVAYNAERRSDDHPFREMYLANRKVKPEPRPLSAREATINFFIKHFVYDAASEAEEAVASVTKELRGDTTEESTTDSEDTEKSDSDLSSWRQHFNMRSAMGSRADVKSGLSYMPDVGPATTKTREAERFETFVEALKAEPLANALFTDLREKKTLEAAQTEALAMSEGEEPRKHIWDLYPSLEEFQKAPSEGTLKPYHQMVGLLTTLDANRPAEFKPETYQYFLAHLDYNAYLYGEKPVIGHSPSPAPPHDKNIAFLLGELISELEIDMKSLSNWMNPLRKFPEPSDWAAIVTSQKNLLVGVAEVRFLGTKIDTAHVYNSQWVGRDYNYRPFPLIDSMERFQLGTELSYAEWRNKTLDAKLTQLNRASADNEEKRPLYAEIAAVRNDVIGERDIREGMPLEHRRFSDRPNDWSTYTFGNVVIEKSRMDKLERRAVGAELAQTSAEKAAVREEFAAVNKVREALVDFRRTTSELILRYDFEGKPLVHTQAWNYQEELNKMLTQFGRQMGAEPTAIPIIGYNDYAGRLTNLFDQREEFVAQAIYHASKLAKERLFRGAKTPEQRQRIEKLVSIIDELYQEEATKIKLRAGLEAVAKNVDDTLSKLCPLTSLETIGPSDEDFRKAEHLIRDEARLAFFDNLANILFVDSGWIEADEMGVDTQRMIQEITYKQTEWKKTLSTLETSVNWLMGGALILSAVMHMNPSVSTLVARSGVARGITLGVTYLVAGGFAAMEGHQVYEDFYERPEELSLLESIRDTHFSSDTPLMKDETSHGLVAAHKAVRAEQGSYFKNTMHVLGFIAGLQALQGVTRLTKWTAGGMKNMLNNHQWWFTDESLIASRAARNQKNLGLNMGTDGSAAAEALSANETREAVTNAYKKVLNAKSGANGSVIVDEAAAKRIAEDVRKQADQMAAQLELNPRTLLPTLESEARIAKGGRGAKALEEARRVNQPRLEFLRKMLEKLRNQSSVNFELEEIIGIAVIATDHTPTWYALLGVPFPYSNRASRFMAKVRDVVHGDLDLMAQHDPEMFYILLRLNQISRPGSTVSMREFFGRRRGLDLSSVPKDIDGFYTNLYRSAEASADKYLKTVTVDSPAEAVLIKMDFIRSGFDEVLGGYSSIHRTEMIQHYHEILTKRLMSKYNMEQLKFYSDLYLTEHLQLARAAVRDRVATLDRLSLWRMRSKDLIRDYARANNATEEEVLQWMTNPQHERYATFGQPKQAYNPEVADSTVALGVRENPAPMTLNDYAHELRGILAYGRFTPNMDLLKAVATEDYVKMSVSLQRTQFFVTRSSGGEGPSTSSGEPDETRPPGDGSSPENLFLNTEDDIARSARDESVPPDVAPAPKPKTEGTGPASADAAAGQATVEPTATAPKRPGRPQFPTHAESMKLYARYRLHTDLTPRQQQFEFVRDHIDVRLVPGEYQEGFKDLMSTGASSQQLQRALGRLKRDLRLLPDYALVDSEVRTLKLAIAHRRVEEISSLASLEQRAGLYEVIAERYLTDVDAIYASEMSLAEAKEIMNIYKNGWPTKPEGLETVILSLQDRTQRKLLEQARAVLTPFHPEYTIGTIDQIAKVLDVPVSLLANQRMAKLLATHNPVGIADKSQLIAQGMLNELYTADVSRGVDHFANIIGAQQEMSWLAAESRATALRRSIEAHIAKNPGPSIQNLLHEEALARVSRAEKFFSEGHAAERAAETSTIEEIVHPRWKYTEVKFGENPWFQSVLADHHVFGVGSRNIVERRLPVALDQGLRDYRFRHLTQEAWGEAVAQEEVKLGRLMHSTMMLEGGIESGALKSAEAIELAREAMRFRYVNAKQIKYSMTYEEAEHFLKEIDMAVSMGALDADGLAKLAPRIQEARDSMRLFRVGTDKLSTLQAGLESYTLNSNSKVPFEVIVDLMKKAEANPAQAKELYDFCAHLLDQSAARFRPNGTQNIADVFWGSFGGSRVWNPAEYFSPSSLVSIRTGLVERYKFAVQIGDTRQAEAMADALNRFGASTDYVAPVATGGPSGAAPGTFMGR